MNIIDLLLALIIVLGAWGGYQRGFIPGALGLLGLAVGLLFAFRTYHYVARLLDQYVKALAVWSLPLAFFLCYLFARMLFSALTSAIVGRGPREPQHGTTNRILGIIPGAINGLITSALISVLLLAVPLSDSLAAKTRESLITAALSPHLAWAGDQFAPIFDKALRHSMYRTTIDASSDKSIALPFSVEAPGIREDLEMKMLQMVNTERGKAGLPPLKPDPEMQAVARAHSRDMFARSYFSHVTPEGKTPSDRARAAGVRFLMAGENLALAPTLEMAHKGLMNSPGHRANMLHKGFGRVGIGVLDGGRHRLMITQNFRN